MPKKVLLISPTPTHFPNAGNRAHILSLATVLRNHQYDVHFFYLDYEEFDEKSLREFWGKRLHIVDKKLLSDNGHIIKRGFSRMTRKIGKVRRRLQLRSNQITTDQYLYNTEADRHFPAAGLTQLESLQKQHHFDIVICEYVFMSKALTIFPDTVFKVIDTHDRFTDRFKIYLRNNLEPGWVSLFRDQEKKALDRADLIIAVEKKEQLYFEEISSTPVICNGFVPLMQSLPEKKFEKILLYFGADNVINHKALGFFIERIFPLILQKHPDVKLLIGGKICDNFQTQHPAVILKGSYKDAKEFYASGDIVINPEPKGTGYKIKTLEALSFGLPVVATEAGASGAIEPFLNHIIIADEPDFFAKAVQSLIEDPDLRILTGRNAREWIRIYNEQQSSEFLEKLP